jgi:hypothetical protein
METEQPEPWKSLKWSADDLDCLRMARLLNRSTDDVLRMFEITVYKGGAMQEFPVYRTVDGLLTFEYPEVDAVRLGTIKVGPDAKAYRPNDHSRLLSVQLAHATHALLIDEAVDAAKNATLGLTWEE